MRASVELKRAFVALVLFFCTAGVAGAAQHAAAVASAHPLATAAGRAILERGGNAFDAAVAVSAALAVVEPYSSGLGGGGFFLLHRASDAHQVMLDARETAPSGVNEAQYLDSERRPLRGATTTGGSAAAIPGLPAGLAHLAGRYGTLPLTATLEPAIRLAREGFPADVRFTRIAKLRESFLQRGTGTEVFLDRGRAPEPGFVVRQPALAATLEAIARSGASAFYEGAVASALLEAVKRAGGNWQPADLSNYRVIEREPVRFRYRGARVTAAALPSAGGVALAQTLGMLEKFPLERIGTPATDHLVVEAMRRAFRDRAMYLADPAFVQVPVARLLSSDYITRDAAGIDRSRATPSERLSEAMSPRAQSANTTHFSIVDAAGNRVAATLTINLLFGSGVVAAGVLLNNEMDDFTLTPEVPNAFQLRGGPANRIEPGKRPLSSMTPVFVEDDKGVLIMGAPGGPRIVSQVLLAVLEYVRANEVDLSALVAAPRYHHQFWPDRVEIEPKGFSADWRAAMGARGHAVHTVGRQWGNMQAVFKAKSGAAVAASDPRGEGIAWY